MRTPKAHNTVKAYAHAWKMFSSWCGEVGLSALPATDETVRNFVMWSLYERTRRYRLNTLKLTLSAISNHHTSAELLSPVTGSVRDLVRNAARDLRERPAGKLALTPGQLRRLCARLENGPTIDIRDKAMFLMQFAAGWRCSEVLGLDLADVRFTKKGFILYLGASKSDQDGSDGRIVGIDYGKRELTCPVRALRAWLEIRGRWPGPLFTPVSASGHIVERGIVGDRINERLKRTLEAIGVDASQFGSHSFRVGFVTTCIRRGASESLIMLRTGHKSLDTMRRYIRTAKAFHANPMAGVL
jgi:integrase